MYTNLISRTLFIKKNSERHTGVNEPIYDSISYFIFILT